MGVWWTGWACHAREALLQPGAPLFMMLLPSCEGGKTLCRSHRHPRFHRGRALIGCRGVMRDIRQTVVEFSVSEMRNSCEMHSGQ